MPTNVRSKIEKCGFHMREDNVYFGQVNHFCGLAKNHRGHHVCHEPVRVYDVDGNPTKDEKLKNALCMYTWGSNNKRKKKR